MQICLWRPWPWPHLAHSAGQVTSCLAQPFVIVFLCGIYAMPQTCVLGVVTFDLLFFFLTEIKWFIKCFYQIQSGHLVLVNQCDLLVMAAGCFAGLGYWGEGGAVKCRTRGRGGFCHRDRIQHKVFDPVQTSFFSDQEWEGKSAWGSVVLAPQVLHMLVTWAVHRPMVVGYHMCLFFTYDTLLP